MPENSPDVVTLHAVLQTARLLPVYAGRRAPKWRLLSDGSISPTRSITTTEQLDYALAHGVMCFGFFPPDAHLIVIDIDKGHSNGIDGFKMLAECLPEVSLLLWAIPHCTTPHSGLHLYFRYAGKLRYKSETIIPGIEIKHTGTLVTVPGSLNPDSGPPYMLDSLNGFKDFFDILSFS